ncbi:hypothetical protein L3X38_022920 [Prunus dulcis]|uniref:Uncharacterized protein n=1 Tax=Prunus dulcis TaxID=3755 RepID=A0AAD4VZG7_PRUDU|nr:hypothetical protein L3X38_022920 [Prunus dulcis]
MNWLLIHHLRTSQTGKPKKISERKQCSILELSVRNCFIRRSVVRYAQLPPRGNLMLNCCLLSPQGELGVTKSLDTSERKDCFSTQTLFNRA